MEHNNPYASPQTEHPGARSAEEGVLRPMVPFASGHTRAVVAMGLLARRSGMEATRVTTRASGVAVTLPVPPWSAGGGACTWR
jgi:hypothetical protein